MVRLVDASNDQVGIIDTNDAIERAREAGLDLVEVAPMSDPPVCQIMDYGSGSMSKNAKLARLTKRTYVIPQLSRKSG